MENQIPPAPEASQAPAENQPAQPLIITLADIDLVKQIIDLASSRGAFKGPELADVGLIYNKLSAFLDNALAQIRADQEVANPSAADAPTQGE